MRFSIVYNCISAKETYIQVVWLKGLPRHRVQVQQPRLGRRRRPCGPSDQHRHGAHAEEGQHVRLIGDGQRTRSRPRSLGQILCFVLIWFFGGGAESCIAQLKKPLLCLTMFCAFKSANLATILVEFDKRSAPQIKLMHLLLCNVTYCCFLHQLQPCDQVCTRNTH